MNIIVQAGGKGTRLRHHTWNKPKCLVSINGKPIIYHLFEKFPNDNFIIIGDYMYETIDTYMKFNKPNVNYKLVKSDGFGNCSGITKAFKTIDNDDSILILWSDLILKETINFENFTKPIVFTTKKFKCRYGITESNELKENELKNGVVGMFYFPKKNQFLQPPDNGEYADWFSENQKDFDIFDINNIDELGDFLHYEDEISISAVCRFYNEVELHEKHVTKKCVNTNFQHLIDNEVDWYKEVSKLNFKRIPKIISENPFCLEKMNGFHAFESDDLSTKEKKYILVDILDTLTELHERGQISSNLNEISDVYINKTIKRLDSVHNLFDFNKKHETLTINGVKCKNYSIDKLNDLIKSLNEHLTCDFFTPIHGDPTFSNIIIDKYLRSWFIDPRGYFSKKGIWGDPLYDYSKLYFSIFGNFDKYNRKKFKLFMNDSNIEILIEDNIFKNVRSEIFSEYFDDTTLAKIKIIHGLIWLSMSGVVLDDLDSIYAAYYLGLYWLETTLSKI